MNRLTLTMFDSLPTEEWLIKKVRENQFESPDSIRSLAREFVKDYRAHAKIQDMLHEWLNTKRFGEITKSESMFPGFDREIVNDLRDSLDAFLADVVSSESSDYRQFFLADWTYTSDRLASFYGDTWKPAALNAPEVSIGPKPRLQRSVSDNANRFGVLSHPYLMSGMSYHDATSPIHRWVFLIPICVWQNSSPTQRSVFALSPDLHPDLTTRQRVHLQTSPDNCQVCHIKINGLGFALENFDAVGRFREQERSKPLDPSGKYLARNGQEVSFSGPKDLAEYIVSSDDAHRAFVNRAFQHFVKQPAAAFGPTTLDELTKSFQKNNFNINELVAEIAIIAATRDPTLTE